MHTKFNDKTKSKYICELIDYGMMVLDNFAIENGKSVNRVAGYYIMPRYNINLEEYLASRNSIDKREVLNICL